jgi:Protein of unknown function (DUF2905)
MSAIIQYDVSPSIGELNTHVQKDIRLVASGYFCPMNSDTGKWIMVIGIVLLFAGVLVYFFHDKLNWIGRLPGDIPPRG